MLIRGLPQRTKSIENIRIDSTRWDHYIPRAGDVVVATYAKNGTTWMEHIVLHLIHQGEVKPTIHDVAIWIDRKNRRESKEQEEFPIEELVEKLRAQTHRRQFKTHLPLDHLPFYQEVKYVVVGRPNRDVWLSWHNHQRKWLERDQMPEDPMDFWVDWIEGRVLPGSDEDEISEAHPHFRYYQQWWAYRQLDNILFVHFNDLLIDPSAEIARVAEFLQIDTPDAEIHQIAEATSFGTMKENADQLLPGAKRAGLFLNKGTNDRWRGMLSEADLTLYEEARWRALGRGVEQECLDWLERDST